MQLFGDSGNVRGVLVKLIKRDITCRFTPVAYTESLLAAGGCAHAKSCKSEWHSPMRIRVVEFDVGGVPIKKFVDAAQ
jgi:hypothetical protein